MTNRDEEDTEDPRLPYCFLETEVPEYQARLATLNASLLSTRLTYLKRSYRTEEERSTEVKRLSLTHPKAYESAEARQIVTDLLYGNRAAINEYLAYLCGDDLLAWAKLVQIFTPPPTS